MEKRKYTKIQTLEAKIVSMYGGLKNAQGDSGTFWVRAHPGQKMYGKIPPQTAKRSSRDTDKAQGSPPRDGQPPHQSEAAELKRLRMENQLLWDFLELGGRRCGKE